jgi:hypothetical protein
MLFFEVLRTGRCIYFFTHRLETHGKFGMPLRVHVIMRVD